MRGLRGALTALLVGAALTGCGAEDAPESAPTTAPSRQAAPAEQPTTAADFLDLADKAMSAQHGWTFSVRGSEGLDLGAERNSASYEATVRRTTDEPWALHSTGTSHRPSGDVAEEVYVVDGTGYVKEGSAGWQQGPLSDPEIANKTEDPLAALDAFREYGDEVTVVRSDGRVELRVRTASSAALPDVRDQGVVEKALREYTPTLEQLRSSGVTADESAITVERAEESVVLDARTHRITAHVFRCTFTVPYGEQTISYSQEVTERNSGPYEGTIALPEAVG
ncbi:hypothetical protein AB0I00_37265 [Streptomyces sp. NPDC050803]|uniref:LptM family lipoprotein n=1 Tax=unclassified Streptomyces TaxID=2593676 RepID=UPI00341FC322